MPLQISANGADETYKILIETELNKEDYTKQLEALEMKTNKVLETIGKANLARIRAQVDENLRIEKRAAEKRVELAKETARKKNAAFEAEFKELLKEEERAERAKASLAASIEKDRLAHIRAVIQAETNLREAARQKELADFRAYMIAKSKTEEAQLKKVREFQEAQARLLGTATSIKQPVAGAKDAAGVRVVGAYSDIRTGTTFKESSASIKNANEDLKKFNDNLGQTKAGAEKLDKAGFPHKLFTTAQYALAGTMIYAVAGAIKEAVVSVVEFDTATRTMAAVLDLPLNKARDLGTAVVDLGTKLGGSLKEIYDVTLALGRAGIASKDLVAGTEAVIRMARLTGDTFDQSTSALISYQQVFQGTGLTIEELGDKLAYIANVSRLSTHDIGTFSNYALSASKSVGLTVDAVGGLAAAFSNAGVNASTIGTQIRTLTGVFTSSSKDIQQFFYDIGVGQQELSTRLQQGPQESNAALMEFSSTLAKISNEDFARFTAGMDKLTADALNKLRQNSDNVKEFLTGSLEESKGALQSTDVILQGFAVSWESMWNQARAVSIDALSETASAAAFYLSKITSSGGQYGPLRELEKEIRELNRKDMFESDEEQAADLEKVKNLKEIVKELKRRQEIEDELRTLAYEKETAGASERLDIAGKAAELIAELKILDANKKKQELKKQELQIQRDLQVASDELARIEAITGELSAADKSRRETALKLIKEATEETSKKTEAEATYVASTVLTTEALVTQVAAQIRNKTASKELVQLAKDRIASEMGVIQTKTTELLLTSKLRDTTREALLANLDFSKSTIDNLLVLENQQKKINSGAGTKKEKDKEVAALNDVAKLLQKIATLETLRDSLITRSNAKNLEAIRAKEKDERQLVDAYLAMIKANEEEYFWINNITKAVEQKRFHLESTLPAQKSILETMKDEEEKLKRIAKLNIEEIKTKRAIEAIERDSLRTVTAKLNESQQALDMLFITNEAEREQAASKYRVLQLEEERKRLLETSNLSEKQIATVINTQVGTEKKLTEEKLKRLKLVRSIEAAEVEIADKRRKEDQEIQTSYERYSREIARELEDAQRLIDKKKAGGEEITKADLKNLEVLKRKQAEADSSYYRAQQMKIALQGSLENSMTSFFDMQSDNWLNFESLAMDVLNTIMQQMLKMSLIEPLAAAGASGIGGLVGGLFADGGVFNESGQVKAYAKGGTFTNSIVKKPTYFASGGSFGVMGEAGPESIMPLQRDSKGRLGVIATGGGSSAPQSVTVNIKNEAGEKLEVTKSSARSDMQGMVLDIVIDAIVRNKKGMRDMIRS